MQGTFELIHWVTLAEITDGLSTTALLSERLRGDGDPSSWDYRRDPWLAGLDAFSTIPAKIQACQAGPAAANPPHFSRGGWSWFAFSYDATQYNHVLGPNHSGPDCSDWDVYYGKRGGSDSGIYSGRSWHNAGVNMAAADGAVHWVKDSISLSVWRALGTRAAGDLVADSF